MSRATWVLGAIAATATALAAWLWVDNRDLRGRLDGVAAEVPLPEPSAAEPSRVDRTAESTPAAGLQRLFRLGRDRTPPPQLEAQPAETRAERRERRMQTIRAVLGRLEGETEDEYRERVVPMITAGLARPRSYYEDVRNQAEAAAGVTPEQREKLDAVFEDAYTEAIDLANEAIASGELTPYERNVGGVLNFVGGLGAVYGSAEARYRETLTDRQREAMRGAGFDLGEYLGVSGPWESLNPPPPPPDGNDG